MERSNERLAQLIKLYNSNIRAFSIKCKISQPTLDKQVKGKRSVSLETLQAVAAACPEVSRDWLFMGEGDMLKSEGKEAERIAKLVDTITTLQEVIEIKNQTIADLKARVN